jgi:Transposase, Mutator family
MGATPRSYQATPIGPRRCCGPHNGNWPRGHRALERTRNTEQPAINQTQPDIEAEHWRRIRHSNFIERTFGETRRRVKVIGRLPGERSCLSLVWAVLDRASHGWRGLTMTPRALRLLQDLRRQLLHPPADKEVIDQAITAAA